MQGYNPAMVLVVSVKQHKRPARKMGQVFCRPCRQNKECKKCDEVDRMIE